MSKRRQTTADFSTTTEKKLRLETMEEVDDSKPVSELSDKELRHALVKRGENIGPMLSSTRYLYEKRLQKLREDETAVPPKVTKTPTKTPTKPGTSGRSKRKASKIILSPTKSPELLPPTSPGPPKIDIASLPDPPNQTDKQIRDRLIELGESPGPINNVNRKFYVELLQNYDNGKMRHANVAKKLIAKSKAEESPMLSSTMIDRSVRGTLQRPRNGEEAVKRPQPALADYPDEMEYSDVGNVSYFKSPYKKTRRSICKAEFESTDFVVFAPTDNLDVQQSFYIDMFNNGIQAIVTQDCSPVSLVKTVKLARNCVKVYAGVTITSSPEGRTAVDNAAQSGVDAVVLSFAKYQCSDSAAIARSLVEVTEGNLTTSYFYYHNPHTPACPLQISKELLKHGPGFQGIFISSSSMTMLQLEVLGIKIYEIDSNNILRSLAHGVDAFANFEGIIAMPLMRKLKEEYYEGNTSECCRLQLVICKLVKLLTKYGDLLPSLHTALKLFNVAPGKLPTPLQPVKNEVILMKELSDMDIDKWRALLL